MFDAVADRQGAELRRQAFLLTGDARRAEWLAQRAAAAAELQWRRFGPVGAEEFARAELVRSYVADPGPAGGAHPTGRGVSVWDALRRLPARRRAVLVLRYDEGLNDAQIAARMGSTPRAVAADVEAGLLTLRAATGGAGDPAEALPSALAEAGARWRVPTPAPSPTAEATPPPAAGTPAPAARVDEQAAPWRRRPRALVVAAAAATFLVTVGAFAVPALLGNDEAGAPAVADVAAATTRLPSTVPSRVVPKGLLGWPARGPRGGDEAVLSSAVTAWRSKAKPAEAPASAASTLYAGEVDGRQLVLVQALDRAGKPRVAQLSGRPGGGLSLVRAEALPPDTNVLSIMPASGLGGALRVLVSPEAQSADGLLASDVSQIPLRKTRVDGDGVSDVLPSPRGEPTCSRVVLMGLQAPLGRSGPRVLQSGIVRADLLTAMTMPVEVGSSSLAASQDALPESAWFADGALLAERIGGRGKVVVAALGPRLAPRPLSATDRRVLDSRAYEVRRGSQRYAASVVRLGGRPLCVTATPVGAGDASRPSAYLLRCPGPRGTAGLLHVVGGPDVQSVQVKLEPTAKPVGQQFYGTSVERPGGTPPTTSFAVLDVVPSGFPCGGGSVQASTGDRAAAPTLLAPYTP